MKSNNRSRQYKWDRRNLRTVSTHVTRQEAELFRLACDRRGTTPYKVLHDVVLQYVRCFTSPEEKAKVLQRERKKPKND